MDNLQLVLNTTSDQWTDINKRAYLLSIKELGGNYYSTFIHYDQVDNLSGLSTQWLSTDFPALQSCIQDIISLSGTFSGLIVDMAANLNANASQAANITKLNAALTTINNLCSKANAVQTSVTNLAALNLAADAYIQNNNATMWQSLLADYGWSSSTQAYGNVTQALEGLTANWIQLSNDINTLVLAPLNESLSSENQSKAIAALTDIGKASAGWDVVGQNATSALTTLQGQTTYTSGDFLYANSPVAEGTTYSLEFTGTGNYMVVSGNAVSADGNFNAGNAAYQWTFQKTQAGYYYPINVSLPGNTFTLIPEFNLAFQPIDPNNTICQYWKFRHLPGDGPNDWHLICASSLYNFAGNDLSLSDTEIQVGQTDLLNEDPEIIFIQQI